MMTSRIDYRPMNVSLRPRSRALHAYTSRAGLSGEAIASGSHPRPDLDLTFRGGRTITDLVFVNRYLGGPAAWDDADRTKIDSALNAALTDPDVEDVIRTGNEKLLGWYSQKGGEIGDIPMMLSGGDLSLVMREVKLHDGSTEPVQLEWSNKAHGPEGPHPFHN